jgi:Icc-related predicted phosphoesterase
MKILALSDSVVAGVYSPNICQKYAGVDLVIGCGDLPYYYLEYVVTMLPADLYYVHGNHDKPQVMSSGITVTEPRGCVSLDGRTLRVGNTILAGLGGSMRYTPGAAHQYSEVEMRQRIFRLLPSLMLNKIRYGRYLDILVAHSPAHGIHDGSDLPHRGFNSFLTLMRLFKPRLMLHGHVHIYRTSTVVTTPYMQTTVINVYPERLVEWDETTRAVVSE